MLYEGDIVDNSDGRARFPEVVTRPKIPTQEHLAKAKDYAEAHKMKLKSDALEAWELEQWRNKRQVDLCQRESKFKHGKAQVLRERRRCCRSYQWRFP